MGLNKNITKLSVVTIALKKNTELLRCIKSCNFKNIQVEHIIVLSEIKNNELQILFPKKKIKIIQDNANGIYSALNVGLKHVTGEFILALHGDNFLKEKYLEIIENCLTSKQSFQFGCDALINNKILIPFMHSKLNFTNIIFGLYPPHPGLILTFQDLRKIGFYNIGFEICSDFDFYIRVYKSKIKLQHKRESIIVSPSGGANTSGLKSILRIIKERIFILSSHYFYLFIIFPITILFGYIIKIINRYKSIKLEFKKN